MAHIPIGDTSSFAPSVTSRPITAVSRYEFKREIDHSIRVQSIVNCFPFFRRDDLEQRHRDLQLFFFWPLFLHAPRVPLFGFVPDHFSQIELPETEGYGQKMDSTRFFDPGLHES